MRVALEEKLRVLKFEKREIEHRLRGLNHQIEITEEELGVDLSPGRLSLLRQLRSADSLSKRYVNQTLKQFDKVAKELQEDSNSIEYLYMEVESWLESLHDAIRTRKIAHLEVTEYGLNLIDRKYRSVTLDLYEYIFNVIRKDLCNQTDGEEREDLIECLDFLKDQLLRFY